MGCAVLIVMSTQISWQLTLLALLPMPLMVLAINRYGEKLHESFQAAQAAFSSLNDRTQKVTSIRMIKAFGLEDRQSALFAADAADTGAKNMRVARIDARFDPTIYIAIGMANLLAIGGGSLDGGTGVDDPRPVDQFCDVSGADDMADAGAGLDVQHC